MRSSPSFATTRRSTSGSRRAARTRRTITATEPRMKTQLDRERLFSFEFFPPKTPEGVEKLRATRKQLAQLDPAFFSVTYGAGGSTREGTLSTVLEIRGEGHEAAPHISCVASTRAQLGQVIEQYKANGIKRVVALRGD